VFSHRIEHVEQITGRSVAKDYEAELEQIDRELESELIRSRYKCV
jgi:hypothetical protein